MNKSRKHLKDDDITFEFQNKQVTLGEILNDIAALNNKINIITQVFKDAADNPDFTYYCEGDLMKMDNKTRELLKQILTKLL